MWRDETNLMEDIRRRAWANVNLWHPFVVGVGDNMQQFRNSFAPYRCDDAELGKVSRSN